MLKSSLLTVPSIDMCLFRKGIKPAWEDRKNRFIKEIKNISPEEAFELFDTVLEYLILSEHPELPFDWSGFNGIYIQRRHKSFRFQIWSDRLGYESR